MWIFLKYWIQPKCIEEKELRRENEIGKDEGRDTVREDGENYIGEGMREEINVAKNEGKMREGIRGSDKTMDVGWDEGK